MFVIILLLSDARRGFALEFRSFCLCVKSPQAVVAKWGVEPHLAS